MLNGIHNKRGFTLLEVIVSTALFTMALTIIVGGLISLNDSNRKARTTRIVMDNLSAAIDSMSRTMRMGAHFNCGCTLPLDTPRDCPMTSNAGGGGDICLAFIDQNGREVTYQLNSSRIERRVNAGSFIDLTDPSLTIDKLRFYVKGGQIGSGDQPSITMLINGSAQITPKTTSRFNVQTTISARIPNITGLLTP